MFETTSRAVTCAISGKVSNVRFLLRRTCLGEIHLDSHVHAIFAVQWAYE
jgi:hypothetical protein